MAQSVVGALRVNLSVGTAQFEAGMKKAAARAKRTAASITGAFSGLKSAAFAGVVAGVGAATAAVIGLGLAVRGSLQHFDALAKTARSVGLTVEQLSALEHAAGLSGLKLEELARGARNFARNALSGIGGTNDFTRSMQALGIEFTNADGSIRNFNDVLPEIADAFSKLPAGASRTALAMKVLGEEMGPRFLNLLENGSAGIRQMTQEAQQLGLVVSTRSAVAAEKFNDTLSKIGSVFVGIGNKITTALLPNLQVLADKFLVLVTNLSKSKVISEGLSAVFTVLSAAIQGVQESINVLVVAIQGLVTVAVKLKDLDFSGAFAAAGSTITNVSTAVRQGAERVAQAAGIIKQAQNSIIAGTGVEPEETPIVKTMNAAAIATSNYAAQTAKAQQAQQLLAQQEAFLNQLRLEYATPEEQRLIRLQKLSDRFRQLGIDINKSAEAQQFYALAAKKMDSEVTASYGAMASSVIGSLGKVFGDSKGFAIATAVIDTFVAFNKALANPPGPPFSYAQAAAALASGLARVRAITSTRPGSGSGRGGGGAAATAGASRGGGGGSSAAAAAQQQQLVNINLQGETFGRAAVVSLIENINEAVADGAVLRVA